MAILVIAYIYLYKSTAKNKTYKDLKDRIQKQTVDQMKENQDNHTTVAVLKEEGEKSNTVIMLKH